METFVYKQIFGREKDDWWFVGRRKVILTVLDVFLKKGRGLTIVDVGCGSGSMIDYLKLYGKVIGIDNDKLAVAFNKKRGKNVKQGDATKLNFKSDSVDLVTLLEVLEHLDNDELAIKETHRVLKPKGIMLLTVPAFSFLWGSHDVAAHHKRRYSKIMLQEKLKRANFKILKISYFNTCLFLLVFLMRFVKKLKETKKVESDFFDYPKIINWLLAKIFSFESVFLKRTNFPFGVSLLVVAEKK